MNVSRSGLRRGPRMMSRVEPPAEDLGVTPERLRHGQDLRRAEVINDEGVRGRAFRVASSLFVLRRADDIDDSHVGAAERWYRDYVQSEGGTDPDAARVSGASDHELAVLARIEASAARTAVRRSLGMCGEVRLKLLMVDCLSFTAMAAVLLPANPHGRRAIAAQMVLLLEQLAAHYDRVDHERRRRRRNEAHA